MKVIKISYLKIVSITLVFAISTLSLFSQSEDYFVSEDTEFAKPNEANGYGKVITKKGALDIQKLTNSLEGKEEIRTKIIGSVNKVCAKKGCWMTMNLDDETTMRVTFKDYGFFVPRDISGKTLVAEGVASYETTSVDMIKHFMEDEGRPQAEIDAITEPQVEMVFVAEGVIIF